MDKEGEARQRASLFLNVEPRQAHALHVQHAARERATRETDSSRGTRRGEWIGQPVDQAARPVKVAAYGDETGEGKETMNRNDAQRRGYDAFYEK